MGFLGRLFDANIHDSPPPLPTPPPPPPPPDPLLTVKPSQPVTRHPCQVCERPTRNIAVCNPCLLGAISILEHGHIGHSEAKYDRNVVVRRADVCYLCGIAPPDEADHIFPRSRGGSAHWSNIGAACWRCNLSKGDRVIELSEEQVGRLRVQHEAIRAIDGRLTDAVWWQWVGCSLEHYLYDDWVGDIDWIAQEREMVEEDVQEWFEDFNVPKRIIVEIVDYIVATAVAGGPVGPRRKTRPPRY